MKIEHIAMFVNDLEKTRDFFIQYFDATANDGYFNPKTQFKSYFLTFDQGTRLEIMSKPNVIDDVKGVEKTGYTHLAFSVDNQQKVNDLTEALRKGGYEVISGPRVTGDGYYESCIIGIEGNIIEITV